MLLDLHGSFSRQGDDWYKVRRLLNMKMLRPKVVGKYDGQMNEVVKDLLLRLNEVRSADHIVPSLQNELFKWSFECKFRFEKVI